MAIIFPDSKEHIPMCIADGYLPDTNQLDSYIEKVRETLPDIRVSDFRNESRFSLLTEIAKSVTSPNSDQIGHYMIFNNTADDKPMKRLHESSHFDDLLLEPGYSLNVIVNENDNVEDDAKNWGNLENYVAIWNSMSGFLNKGEASYGDYNSHLGEAQKLLREIQEIYDTPRIENLIKTRFRSSHFWDLSQ